VADRLARGDSLEQAAGSEADVPALWTCVVSATAPRGDLPAALAELARNYEMRAQQWTSAMRIILGPLLLLIVGAMLGGIVVGVIGACITVINSLM
jgi:type II secretory pathway component PulF